MSYLKPMVTRARAMALSLVMAQSLAMTPPAVMAYDTAVRVAGQQAFPVTASAGGLSASERVSIMQRNLDNALAAASDRTPSAVAVTYVKGVPILTVAGYYVATVDANSARSAGTTPGTLASRWADGLKRLLANTAAVDAYVAQLTGGSSAGATASTGTNYKQGRLVYIPQGMVLPIKLTTSISTGLARAGDPIEAKVTENVVLGDSYVPAGSLVVGQITDAKAGSRLSKSGELSFKFTKLRTPDGAESAINAHLIGAAGGTLSGSASTTTVKGETMSTKVKTAALHGAIGAGSGALLGTTIGAIAGRSGKGVGRGALAGLAIGAGLGVAESLLLRKGKDATLSSGETMKMQLDSPATLATGNYVTANSAAQL